MHKHELQDNYDSDYLPEDKYDDDVDFNALEEESLKNHTKTGRLHARRSVEQYLERKRLRERYKELFDDNYEDN